ncbi:MAG: hypothetical protein P8013_04075 [Candidatus Sulfobium sp.]|jgi:uncharacterized protein YoxC
MMDVWLIVIGVSSLVIDVMLVLLLLQVLRMIISLRKTVEEKVDPVLKDVQGFAGNVREISDNAKGVVEDVREFSASVREVGKTVRAVNDLAGAFGTSTTVRALSLKAGVVAGLQFLLTNLLGKGDGK